MANDAVTQKPGHPGTASPIEGGDPADDGRAFRRCLGQFATGVTVVTADSGDRITGVTANSFSSVSMDPPLVLWSIKRSSDSWPTFESATHFAVNILASSQTDHAANFARSGDKFEGIDWAPGAGGAPLLANVAATLECRRHAEFDGGDHIIMVGHVERFNRFDRPVLLFAQGRYGLAVDHPGSAPSTAARTAAAPVLKPLLSNLLRQALVGFTAALKSSLAALGLSTNESRMIATISYFPGLTLRDLAEASFLGTAAAEDAADTLIRRGFAQRDENGGFTVTDAGLDEVHAIRGEALACEARVLSEMSPSEIDAAHRVLEELARQRR